MTIDFNTLFTRLGKAFYAGQQITTAAATTINDAVEAYMDTLHTEEPTVEQDLVSGIGSALTSLQGSMASSLSALVSTPTQRLIVEMVNQDVTLYSQTTDVAVAELIAQMIDDGETIQANTVSAVVSYGVLGSSSGTTANVGSGVIVLSVKRPDGKVNEFIYAETILATVTSVDSDGVATWQFLGEPSVGVTAIDWPKGSGISKTFSAYAASDSDNEVPTGDFETDDSNVDGLPDEWIVSVGDLVTNVVLTDTEIQTVTINGTPTSGWYSLQFTDKDSRMYETAPLVYNATAAQVQAALRLLPWLSDVTVTSTGTTPNLTHSVVFENVPNPQQLAYVDHLAGGSPTITITTPTPGSAYTVRGSRCLEIIGDSATLTEIQCPLDLDAITQYGVNLWLAVDVVPASGELTVDLVDGIGGTIVCDEEGTANSLAIDLTALTAVAAARNTMFRTPRNLPPEVYLRLRLTTAIPTGTSLFVDEVCMVAATELYASGIWAASFQGPDSFVENDAASVVASNNWTGKVHSWLARSLSLQSKRILFPVSVSPTIPDSVIS